VGVVALELVKGVAVEVAEGGAGAAYDGTISSGGNFEGNAGGSVEVLVCVECEDGVVDGLDSVAVGADSWKCVCRVMDVWAEACVDDLVDCWVGEEVIGEACVDLVDCWVGTCTEWVVCGTFGAVRLALSWAVGAECEEGWEGEGANDDVIVEFGEEEGNGAYWEKMWVSLKEGTGTSISVEKEGSNGISLSLKEGAVGISLCSSSFSEFMEDTGKLCDMFALLDEFESKLEFWE
jgi:hypothetical protein